MEWKHPAASRSGAAPVSASDLSARGRAISEQHIAPRQKRGPLALLQQVTDGALKDRVVERRETPPQLGTGLRRTRLEVLRQSLVRAEGAVVAGQKEHPVGCVV